MRKIVAMTLTLLALSACANVGLRDLRNANADGPDEFIIEPKAPLQEPANFSDLPPPTPGAGNLTDRFPKQEAIVAVGGRAESSEGGVPSRDGALVQAASRFGVTENIRGELAAADEDFRRRKARFTQFRLVPVDRYNQAYSNEALDPNRVASQWRAQGAKTPAYPPLPQRRVR